MTRIPGLAEYIHWFNAPKVYYDDPYASQEAAGTRFDPVPLPDQPPSFKTHCTRWLNRLKWHIQRSLPSRLLN